MTRIYGADVAEMRTLASFLDQSAERLQVLSVDLGRRIESSRSWSGPDADRFRSAWPADVASPIRSTFERLRDCAAALRRNADEQQNASAAADGATSSSNAAPAGSGSTAQPPMDLRAINLNGIGLWDMAKVLAGTVGAFESSVAGIGIAESVDSFATSAQSGDAYGMFDSGTDLLSQSLQLAPPGSPPHLFGTAIDIWKFVGESAAQSDLSSEGIAMVGQYITQDPVGAAGGALDALGGALVPVLSAGLALA